MKENDQRKCVSVIKRFFRWSVRICDLKMTLIHVLFVISLIGEIFSCLVNRRLIWILETFLSDEYIYFFFSTWYDIEFSFMLDVKSSSIFFKYVEENSTWVSEDMCHQVDYEVGSSRWDRHSVWTSKLLKSPFQRFEISMFVTYSHSDSIFFSVDVALTWIIQSSWLRSYFAIRYTRDFCKMIRISMTTFRHLISRIFESKII